jgi:hypothetical protein
MQLQNWLDKHAGAVEGLEATSVGGTMYDRYEGWQWVTQPPLLTLPVLMLKQLHSLDLSLIKAQLSLLPGVTTRESMERASLTEPSSSSGDAASSSSSTDVVLPQLQELRLWDCCLTVQLASQLLSTTALTELQWNDVLIRNDNWGKPKPQDQVMSALWQNLQLLPKLSVLKLGGSLPVRLTAAEVTHISHLQHLQRLSLTMPSRSLVSAVAAAAAGLTSLVLSVSGDDREPHPAALVEDLLSRVSLLQSLSCTGVRMQPSTFGGATGPQGLTLARVLKPNGSEWSSRALLAALQPLTQLQHLALYRCRLHLVDPQPEQEGGGYQCFSALTASTQLTALDLVEYAIPPVPQAAFEHMFLPGRVLPHLKVLGLTSSNLRLKWAKIIEPTPRMPAGYKRHVEAAQVAMIAASCPALQEVKLQGVTAEDFDVGCLKQLPVGVKTVDLGWSRS